MFVIGKLDVFFVYFVNEMGGFVRDEFVGLFVLFVIVDV